ncbi:hypothetical protein MATL_G00048740 [Megalops atlanticus]|uniref:Uncharacterized protein n=1 Tax=Megalops atlanticus TaxID=7932 RepID=A0A9D3TAR5_MEGAT|nr:hypothetical protein MATL_G00048740 [Megalops atlanticus]
MAGAEFLVAHAQFGLRHCSLAPPRRVRVRKLQTEQKDPSIREQESEQHWDCKIAAGTREKQIIRHRGRGTLLSAPCAPCAVSAG